VDAGELDCCGCQGRGIAMESARDYRQVKDLYCSRGGLKLNKWSAVGRGEAMVAPVMISTGEAMTA